MFQFSTLLSRPDAGASRRRPSTADPQQVPLSAQFHDDDALASAAGQCVSDRVRRDLDDQMHRLAELLDRVESLEFEHEAESADIFSLGKTECPEQPAEQPRILDDTESTPETDGDSAAPDSSADWEFDVYADEGATGDESAASSIVVPPVIPLSTREVEFLTAPSLICNSPGAAALEPELFSPPANPRRTVADKPEAQARVEYKPEAQARNECKPEAQVRDEYKPEAQPTTTERRPLARASDFHSGVKTPNEQRPHSKPIASDTRPTDAPAQNEKAPAPTSAWTTRAASGRRQLTRAVSPRAPADTSTGVVQDFCPNPLCDSLESTPPLETSDSPGCLTLAAPNFEESSTPQCDPFDYPLTTELTAPPGSETDEATSTSSAGVDRSTSETPDAIECSEPYEEYPNAIDPNSDMPTSLPDTLIQAFDNTLGDTRASAEAFPSRFTPQAFAPEPCDSAGVHTLIVSDVPACATPTPSPITASAYLPSAAPSHSAHGAAVQHESPIGSARRSLRRTPSLESSFVGASLAPAPSKFGGPQVWNILAVIGGLLTLAALAYVASDLASWFDPIR